MKRSLTQQIERFLAQRKKTDANGHAAVSGAELLALEAIVKGLIAAKYGESVEPPVEVSLVDRTTCEGLRFFPLPYLNANNLPERARVVAINAGIVEGQVQHILRETAHAPASLMAAPLPLAPAGAKPVARRKPRR